MDCWTEKYRAHSCKDSLCPPQVQQMLENAKTDLPNMILYGPPGSGKSTAATALFNDLFEGSVQDRVLRLNASVDRGIQSVRSKIKQYAEVSKGGMKVVLLEEADRLTYEAQCALRRVIEESSKNTRFCFTCNHVSNMIDPITSRCQLFHFNSLQSDEMKNVLQNVAAKESISISTSAIQDIVDISAGDARRALNLLQSCCNAGYFDENILGETSGSINQQQLTTVLAHVRKTGARAALETAEDLASRGLLASQLARQLAAHGMRFADEAAGTISIAALRLKACARQPADCTLAIAHALWETSQAVVSSF